MLRSTCLALVLFIGCGSDGGSSAGCSFSPCGGDPTGHWTLDKICSAGISVPNCTGATGQLTPSGWTGTLHIGADKTYVLIQQGSYSGNVMLPASCVGMAMRCDQLNTMTMGSSGSSLTCTGMPAMGCACTVSGMSMSSEMGTYAVSGNTILTMPASGSTGMASTIQYCVSGNTISFKDMKDPGTPVLIYKK